MVAMEMAEAMEVGRAVVVVAGLAMVVGWAQAVASVAPAVTEATEAAAELVGQAESSRCRHQVAMGPPLLGCTTAR